MEWQPDKMEQILFIAYCQALQQVSLLFRVK